MMNDKKGFMMNDKTNNDKPNIPLIGGIVAAFLSTVCCIVPLLLLTLGVGGVWMSYLTALSPYKPFFIIVACLLLWIAYQKIFLTQNNCEDDKICAVPKNKAKYKLIFWIATALLLGSATVSLWAPLLY